MLARVRSFFAGLHALFRRRQLDADLDAELRAYFDEAVDRNVAAGMDREDAVRAARVGIGSFAAVKDQAFAAGWESCVDSLGKDVRFAARSLRRSPVFTAVAVITLALGIGANTAIFSVVNGLMLRMLPVQAPHELMLVSSAGAVNQGWPAGWPYVIWEQLRRRSNAFDGAIAWSGVGSPVRFDLSPRGQREMVDGLYVSGTFFPSLGVTAAPGRTLTEADDTPGGGPDGLVAVIGHGFWQRHFAGAEDVVGAPLTLDGVPFRIAGVAPPGFSGMDVGRQFDVAVPLAAMRSMPGGEDWLSRSGPAFLNVAVRLREHQARESAVAILRGVQAQVFDGAIPDAPPGDRYRAEFLSDPFTLIPAGTGVSEMRGTYARPLIAMLAVVGLVLLIACTNIATLMLSRAAARQQEVDVRRALGAPRWRLASHVLAEGALLGAAGALLGLLVAAGAGPALAVRLITFGAPSELPIALDWPVLAFTSAITVFAVLLFGAYPALRAAHPRGATPEARSLPSNTSASAVARWPLTTQIALTLVLLVAAGLFVRTFESLARRPPGFDRDRILVASVDASRSSVSPSERMAHYQRLLDAVARVPGVARAAASEFTPVGFGTVRVSAIDIPGVAPQEQQPVPTYAVTPGWFATYGSVLRAGRDFDAGDTARALPVAIVNESLARRLFGGANPVGRAVRERVGPGARKGRDITIVGVAGDAILGSLWDVVPPTLYVPLAQSASRGELPDTIRISVRSAAGSPSSLPPAIASALGAADRNVSFSFQLLDEAVDTTIAWERLMAVVAALFGALALVLAAVGVYGITAYTSLRRRSEIGIRVALGATRRDVVRLVIGATLAAASLGIVGGVAAAASLTRYLEGMLFGVTPLDAATFAAAVAMLLGIALVAALVPARRAANADPLAALRCE